jgi:hypothetical protein
MSKPTPQNLSPTELVNSLDPEAIAARLDALDREAQALRVLLRSARARQAAQVRRLHRERANDSQGGPGDAS